VSVYVQDLARTSYNRGILEGQTALPGDPAFGRSEAGFREAIRLLEPLATGQTAERRVRQDLARAFNNLGSLVATDPVRGLEARSLYERAIAIHEGLLAEQSDNREYTLELAKFSNNLSDLLRETGLADEAAARNGRALTLLDELARPAPSLGVERADAHNLRGHILETRSLPDALAEYRLALGAFADLAQSIETVRLADFHLRFGDLLHNLALLSAAQPVRAEPRALLHQAVNAYVSIGERALASGLDGAAGSVLGTLTDLDASLADTDRPGVLALYADFQQRIRRTP
jgi:tetratricopeptide (TPR) repeat protein